MPLKIEKQYITVEITTDSIGLFPVADKVDLVDTSDLIYHMLVGNAKVTYVSPSLPLTDKEIEKLFV